MRRPRVNASRRSLQRTTIQHLRIGALTAWPSPSSAATRPPGVLFERARGRGHTKREAMRIVKRNLYNIVHCTMLRDTLRNGQTDQLQEVA